MPHITFGDFKYDHAVSWFKEMEQSILSSELFLSTDQFEMVKKAKLFKSHNVNFIGSQGDFISNKNFLDITKFVPRVQTAPILVLTIAIYMGFKKIYLLGIDHDWFIKKEYKYAFGQVKDPGLDIGVDKDGKMNGLLLINELPVAAEIWKQYNFIKSRALENNIEIYNCTDGGLLDVFERDDIKNCISKN